MCYSVQLHWLHLIVWVCVAHDFYEPFCPPVCIFLSVLMFIMYLCSERSCLVVPKAQLKPGSRSRGKVLGGETERAAPGRRWWTGVDGHLCTFQLQGGGVEHIMLYSSISPAPLDRKIGHIFQFRAYLIIIVLPSRFTALEISPLSSDW